MEVRGFILFIFILAKSDGALTNYKDENVASSKILNTRQLIAEHGFISEEYEVVTEDGYIINITRIVNTGPVVLMIHGLMSNADDWLTLGNDSLPYVLADAGYDVYLGNTRGNRYVKHVTLSTDQKEFWDFTFHEIGYYDLPAMMNFALQTSGKRQLVYVGHSQGTAVFFVMASMRPDYNKKVSLMISMSTIAWLRHPTAPIAALAPFHENIIKPGSKQQFRVLSHNGLVNSIMKKICPMSNFTMNICTSFLYTVFGFDYGQYDLNRFRKLIGQSFGGTSSKNVVHYSQLITSKNFQLFNYKSGNMKVYGFKDPPSYPVGKITAPVAIMYCDNDWLSSMSDVRYLMKRLPNVVEMYRVPHTSFSHNSFTWGKEARALVYDKVLWLANKYSGQ